MSEALTIELHNRLKYDQQTGAFTWLVSVGRVKAGTVAGVRKPSGYTVIQIDGRSYGAHRLAWLYVYGAWPQGEVDHINGIRSDNRIENLRDVDRSVNQQNQRRPQAHNRTSKHLGVSFNRRRGTWRAAITLRGRTIEIGSFGSEEEAYAAYVAKKRAIHEGCTV